jgi:hypothetical protein
MKKLGKLKLNSEKMLSHNELVSFRGGSGSGTYNCHKECITEGVLAGCRNCTDSSGGSVYICDC